MNIRKCIKLFLFPVHKRLFGNRRTKQNMRQEWNADNIMIIMHYLTRISLKLFHFRSACLYPERLIIACTRLFTRNRYYKRMFTP